MRTTQVRPNPDGKRRPLVLEPDVAALARFVAWYEGATVGDVCGPILEPVLRKRFEKFPEVIKARFAELYPEAAASQPAPTA